ncbi:MAG: potassium channel protein [Thermodesulfobacteriota bacterium]
MPSIFRKKILPAGLLLVAVTAAGTFGYHGLAILAGLDPPWPLADCLYMTVITLTTVGFGEVIDVAAVPGARLFTMFILGSGLGLAAYFVSTLTAFLVEGELKNVYWRKRMAKEIARLRDHFIVCGLGRVGFYAVRELVRTGRPFVAIDGSEERIRELQEELGAFPAVVGDATHAAVLQEAGVERAVGVLSTLGDDKDELCVVVTCRQLNPAIRVLSRCGSGEFASKLELVGAEVVIPDLIGGLRMASQMIRPRVVRYLDTMLRDETCVVRIEELTLPAASSLAGRTVGSLDLTAAGNLLLLAVINEGSGHPMYNPPASYVLKPGDTLVFQAEPAAMARFRQAHAGAL